MTLRECFKKLIEEYADVYETVTKSKNYKNPIGNFIRHDIVNEIIPYVKNVNYMVKGSCGAGKYTTVPWIAIFDKRITTSAQRGVYIVYLLNKDTKELYLTLNQGATDVSQADKVGTDGKLAFTGISGVKNVKTLDRLQEKAEVIRRNIDSLSGSYTDAINCGSPAYDAGSIFCKKYTLENLPNDEQLVDDLKAFMCLYESYYQYSVKHDNEWWPSKSEYDPDLSKEKWLELLNTPEVFTESALKMIAEFYAYGGTATCAQLASHYKRTYNYYLMTSVHLAERVVKATGCPVVEEERNAQNAKWWPVLYVGKDAEKEEKGSFIWKIRDELYEALTEFGIEKYLSSEVDDVGIEEGETQMTSKEAIEVIKKYIANKGFTYEDDLIENFYLSLKSKPFVILAGTSGTGKTRLVKLFAEAIGAEMKLIPVRPDWSDSSDLFGHADLNGSFNPGAIIDFVKEAEENKDKPYFLCLDEMNLARVEYYLSDFLSVIETRDRNEDLEIVTDPLIDVEYYKSEEAKEKYGKLIIPENLYIIGTVNMDETTFPFSKKVLDRANTIEFSFVDLLAKPRETTTPIKPLNLKNDFLKTEYLYLADCSDTEVINSVCGRLQEINEILVKANLHVGYRVRDEIVFYMMNNKKANLLLDDAAFDHEIMQKILPRIQGSSAAIKEVLSQLFIKCAGDYSGLTGMTTFEQMNTYLESKDAGKYPNSAKKIAFMMRRYEEDGFTSYWL